MANCCATSFVDDFLIRTGDLPRQLVVELCSAPPERYPDAGQHHIKMLGLLAQLQRDLGPETV